MKEHTCPIYLFSIDLEDIRFRMPEGLKYQERVPSNTIRYLKWLKANNFKCTFFTVGDIAQNYPSLIKTIIDEGHEIGCHTNTHIALDKMTKSEFEKDISQNLNNLEKAGAKNIVGFRAPYFSLTEKTAWVFDILKEFDFKYSSSVYPAKNPFYGWEDFGTEVRKLDNGLIEMPMTVKKFVTKDLAYSGGVYFRNLPMWMIKNAFSQHFKNNDPILGYFHPYDIDCEQEKFMHPEINNSHFYNFLIRNNRKNVFNRLDKLKSSFNYRIITYNDFISNL